MARVLLWLALLASFAAGTGRAAAQELTPIWWVDELRGGLFLHSVDKAGPDPLFGLIDTTRGVDANVELLFTPFDLGDFSWLGEFRPHVGATVSLNGLESMVYAGLSWTWHVLDGPVFVEASLGGSLNNGVASGAAYPARSLGCSLLFRESASVGVDVSEQASVMLTVEHASHAGLCSGGNEGLTNLGVRVGWRF